MPRGQKPELGVHLLACPCAGDGGNKVSISKHVTIFSDDFVDWRSGDCVWTVTGEVPLLSIGCPGASAQVYAGLAGTAFPVARMIRALDPANTPLRVYVSR